MTRELIVSPLIFQMKDSFLEDLLFLGEWAKPYGKNQGQVLGHPWLDRNECLKAYEYTVEVYEEVLETLAVELNKLHQLNYSTRSWEMILGPWLILFIQSFYERYCLLKKVSEETDLSCWIFDTQNVSHEHEDSNTLREWITGHEYNFFLYSYIIQELNLIPHKILRNNSLKLDKNNHRPPQAKNIQNYLFDFSKSVFHLLGKRNVKHFFALDGVPTRDQVKLSFQINKWPYTKRSYHFHSVTKKDMSLRKELDLHFQQDEFQKILGKILIDELPLSFIETFKERFKKGKKIYPTNPQSIVVDTSLYTDDLFKTYLAEQTHLGAKLIIHQHGGAYGVSKYYPLEYVERKVADEYFSWGWQEKVDPKVISLPSPKLSILGQSQKKEKETSYNTDGPLLILGLSQSPYTYWIYSHPIGPLYLNYLEFYKKFIHGLEKKWQKKIVVRLAPPQDYGWEQRKRWENILPNIQINSTEIPLNDQLNEASLVICSYNSTSYLETMTMNIPTLLLWDSWFQEVRSQVSEDFTVLKDKGLFIDDSEKASHFINHTSSFLDWWRSDEIQITKNLFCSTYAKSSFHWTKYWKEAFRNMKK